MQVLEQCREQLPVAFHGTAPVAYVFPLITQEQLSGAGQLSQPKGQPTKNIYKI